MSKHTTIKHVPGTHSPGPWKAVVDDESREDGADEILDARGIVIARVEGDSEFREIYNGGEIEGPGCTANSDALNEEDANARLIASAPALYEVARKFITDFAGNKASQLGNGAAYKAYLAFEKIVEEMERP